MRYDELVYRQEVEYAGGMTPWRLIIIMVIGLLLGGISSVYAQQTDPLENQLLMDDQAHTTARQHFTEDVSKLIQDRRQLKETLKNERDYWAAYVKGLETPKSEDNK